MNKLIIITKAETLDGTQVIATLSDGRVLAVTLLEMLSIEADSVAQEEEHEPAWDRWP